MSSTIIKNPVEQIKKKISKKIPIIDSEKLLFEKNEALKDLELEDELEDNILEKNYHEKTKCSSIKRENSIIKNNSNIVIISDRSVENDSILDMNIYKLESQIKGVDEYPNLIKS